ncbi:MAG: AGE family epimerase/isomerase [Anaerolineae bacterium]|nr:AGE family epimerase/isomerase [Anaerolineae bacterium]
MIGNLKHYQAEVEQELKTNILPFHIAHTLDRENGGFYGSLNNALAIKKDAPKGLIHNARLLWTYSHVYRVLADPVYLETADRAYHYLLDNFWDDEWGGFFWLLDYRGQPIKMLKMTYGQAFGIYGVSEYYLATGHQPSLAKALEIYRLLEQHCYDRQASGYFEGAQRDWSLMGGLKLGEEDVAAQKSMNTHLHLMEAFTNLLRAGDDAGLKTKQKELILATLDHIIDPATAHFKLFFDETWRSLSAQVSYGHDIEGSWLLVEAGEVLGDDNLLARLKDVALKMAQATYEEGFDEDGGLFYQGDPTGIIDPAKHWWPQAEAMVGFLSAYQLSRHQPFLQASLKSWDFIKQYLIDREHGEWFWGVDKTGRPLNREKAGMWKSPYHNSRACLEVSQRVDKILSHQGD